MYKVYCLVDPFTMLPFYIGSTRRTLEARLTSHISSRLSTQYKASSIIDERNRLIIDIISKDKKPLIYLLFVTDAKNIDISERFFYFFIKSFGVQLIQNQYRFTYSSHYCKNSLK